MKWRYDRKTGLINDEDFHDSPEAAIETYLQRRQPELKNWIAEALAALESEDIYRGGGVLALAELMKELSHAEGALALYKNRIKK